VKIVKSVPVPKKEPFIFDWWAIAERLRANAGEWGVISDVSRSMPHQIKIGNVAALRPPTDWEVTARKDPALAVGRTDVYLRYIGDK
jgi:hypothetical protein